MQQIPGSLSAKGSLALAGPKQDQHSAQWKADQLTSSREQM